MSERRAPVQADVRELDDDRLPWLTRRSPPPRAGTLRNATDPGAVPGTISWAEHEEAYREYARRYGTSQSAERLAERAGFGWFELCEFLGHEPRTWKPVGSI